LFLFPLGLAQYHYWVQPHFSFAGVVVPFIIDLALIAGLIYLGRHLHHKLPRGKFLTFVFFAIWFAVGLGLHLQFIPLDMTACETWFYFPMVGLLGMIGVTLQTYPLRLRPRWITSAIIIILALLAVRTATRAYDWHSEAAIAYRNLTVAEEDFNSEVIVSTELAKRGQTKTALQHAQHAVDLYPTYTTYSDLGGILLNAGDYAAAKAAYTSALRYNDYYAAHENLALLALYTGDYEANRKMIQVSLGKFPKDGVLWQDLAILMYLHDDKQPAKEAMQNAAAYGTAAPYYYQHIVNYEPIELPARPSL
jgi:tetratricopeptide (TPR) repeat protein